MKNNVVLTPEEHAKGYLVGLQQIVLLKKGESRMYYIARGVLSAETLIRYSSQLVYPISKFVKDTGDSYYRVYRYLDRKGAILKEPAANSSWFCLKDYKEEKLLLLGNNFNVQLDESHVLKNVFGYVTPKKLSELFPWIDFDNPLIKFLHQPWLILTNDGDLFYFLLEGDPFDPYGIPLEDSDLHFLYHNLLVNKNVLAAVQKVSPVWAWRKVHSARLKKVKSGMRYVYAKADSLMTYAEFAKYIKRKYSFQPYRDLVTTSTLHEAMDAKTLKTVSREVIDEINQYVINPVRKNLDLKVKLILKNRRR